MLGGCLGLVGGAVVTAAAIVASTPALLLLGTVMAGLGFGPGIVLVAVFQARARSLSLPWRAYPHSETSRAAPSLARPQVDELPRDRLRL